MSFLAIATQRHATLTIIPTPPLPPHAIYSSATALYVMLDTLDKGKKAYDGEAGEFFFEYRSVCLMVGNKKIKIP